MSVNFETKIRKYNLMIRTKTILLVFIFIYVVFFPKYCENSQRLETWLKLLVLEKTPVAKVYHKNNHVH